MVGARSAFPLSKKEVIIKEQGRKERKAPGVMDSPETSVGAHVSLTIGTETIIHTNYQHGLIYMCTYFLALSRERA